MKYINEIVSLMRSIEVNISSKDSFSIVVSDNSSEIFTPFKNNINLKPDRNYEIALHDLSMYYSFPNIDDSNNVFKYMVDDKSYQIEIPTGLYEFKDIVEFVKSNLKAFNFKDIVITADMQTLKTVIVIPDDYQVDFGVNNSLGKVLGFNPQIYQSGVHKSENIINILSLSAILVNLNIINGSYVNGASEPVIYSFFPDASPGMKIIQHPKNLIYLPISVSKFNSMTTYLTDQNGKPLDLRGEVLTIRYHIRER